MAEPFRFTYGEVSLSNFLQNRELNEKQRQFDLEQSRIQRQESLMNFFRQRDDIRQEKQLNFNISKVEPETYPYQVDAPIPYQSGTKTRVSASGNYLKDSSGKLMIDSPTPKDYKDSYKTALLPGSSTQKGYLNIDTGEYKKDANGKYIIADIDRPSEFNALTGAIQELTLAEKQRKAEEDLNKVKQYYETGLAKYNQYMTPYVVTDKQADKEDFKKAGLKAGDNYWIDDNGNYLKTYEQASKYAENKVKSEKLTVPSKEIADKLGLSGAKWYKDDKGNVVIPGSNDNKIMTKQEFIADFEKEEGRKPTGAELLQLRQQGLWK